MPLPSPEQQIQFLVKIQRLLGEGRFVASYKTSGAGSDLISSVLTENVRM